MMVGIQASKATHFPSIPLISHLKLIYQYLILVTHDNRCAEIGWCANHNWGDDCCLGEYPCVGGNGAVRMNFFERSCSGPVRRQK
jgi:hypothetical protein